ncbi:MAG: hypothetical protein LBT19_03075 [Candidatus Nomurabacteria bacterium]|jgi:hypothetical protein|nr:hypothetical protein [Candidatus Nomurabacteria bacterium]
MENIIEQFLDIENTKQKKHYFINPDTEVYLLAVSSHNFENAFFVLVETDYFDFNQMSAGIKKQFSVNSIEWVQPKQKKVISVNVGNGEFLDQIELTILWDGRIFALALVSDRTIFTKS